MEGWPKAVAGAAEVAADGSGIQAGVDAGEEDDEIFGDEIRDVLVARGEELGFGGFPGCGRSRIHMAALLEGILLFVKRLHPDVGLMHRTHNANSIRKKGRRILEMSQNQTIGRKYWRYQRINSRLKPIPKYDGAFAAHGLPSLYAGPQREGSGHEDDTPDSVCRFKAR